MVNNWQLYRRKA